MTERIHLSLREHSFSFKPSMNAKDFGLITGIRSTEADLFEVMSGAVRRTLVKADRARWDALWEDDLDEPISFDELTAFVDTLIKEQAARPTGSPSPSGNTHASTRTPSTGASDSREAAASIPSRSVPV